MSEILAIADIVAVVGGYVTLEKAGDNYRTVCPFHADSDPSLMINPQAGYFKCFGAGCGVGGNVIKFVSLMENVSYGEAANLVAKKMGRPDLAAKVTGKEFDLILATNERVAKIYHSILMKNSAASKRAREFVKKRRISGEAAAYFKLGYSPNSWTYLANREDLTTSVLVKANLVKRADSGLHRDYFKNRIIFPYHQQQAIIGFSGRTIGISQKELKVKFLNSPTSDWFKKKEILYGWYFNSQAIRQTKEVIIVEGPFDLIQLWQRGIRNVLAVSGSYFTAEQSNFLSRVVKKATIFADGDKAGSESAIKSGGLLIEKGVEVQVVFKDGKDPDEIARYATRFDWDIIQKRYGTNYGDFVYDHGGKSKTSKVKVTLEKLAAQANPIELDSALQDLSEKSGYSVDQLGNWIQEYKQNPFKNYQNPVVPKGKREIEEELLILAAITKQPVEVGEFLQQRLSPKLLELISIDLESLGPRLATSPLVLDRMIQLSHVENLEKYQRDLIARMELKELIKEKEKLINDFNETNEVEVLDDIQALITAIAKRKYRG